MSARPANWRCCWRQGTALLLASVQKQFPESLYLANLPERSVASTAVSNTAAFAPALLNQLDLSTKSATPLTKAAESGNKSTPSPLLEFTCESREHVHRVLRFYLRLDGCARNPRLGAPLLGVLQPGLLGRMPALVGLTAALSGNGGCQDYPRRVCDRSFRVCRVPTHRTVQSHPERKEEFQLWTSSSGRKEFP